MNDVLVWGPLTIPVRYLFLAVSGLTGYLALAYRLKAFTGTSNSKDIPDDLLNTFIIGLLIWKLSPLIWDTMLVIENPLSLLYFTGGTKGLLLAFLSAVIMLGARTKKKGYPVMFYPDAVVTVLLAGGSMFSLLVVVFRNGGIMLVALSLVTFAVYCVQLYKPRPLGIIHLISLKSGWGNLITLLIVVGLIGWSVYNHHSSQEDIKRIADAGENTETGNKKGNRAPDFTLTSLDGKQVSLSDYRGKKVMVNFWATWCPPCKAEMPHMEKFYQTHRQDDIVILGINVTNTEKSPDAVKAFVSDRELTFPIVLDSSGRISGQYDVMSYPTTFVIDPNGTIRDIYQGAMSYETLTRAVK